jgi:hypothetical protein
MDPRKWLPTLPLYGAPACVYCGNPADTSDHTPPRCLLRANLPKGLQVMVIPACLGCNSGFSEDENRTAAVVSTLSFTASDRDAVAAGGSVFSALQRDAALRTFIHSRLGNDGIFHPDAEVLATISRVMRKTVVGLLFHEFGRVVPIRDVELVAIEHNKNVNRRR